MPNSILFLGISLQFKDINKLNEWTKNDLKILCILYFYNSNEKNENKRLL